MSGAVDSLLTTEYKYESAMTSFHDDFVTNGDWWHAALLITLCVCLNRVMSAFTLLFITTSARYTSAAPMYFWDEQLMVV